MASPGRYLPCCPSRVSLSGGGARKQIKNLNLLSLTILLGASFFPAMAWVQGWENPSPLSDGDFGVLWALPLHLGTAAMVTAPWGLDRHEGLPEETVGKVDLPTC